MLLGPRRVESIERGPDGLRAVLRCHCDTVIVWSPDGDDGGRAPAEGQEPIASTCSEPSGATTVMAGAVKLDT